MEPDFRQFIQIMLKRANINAEYREIFTNPENLNIFLAAVTHPTHDLKHNYQELEFIGDGIIKGILSQYIPRRFPNLGSNIKIINNKLTKEGPLSKIRRLLEQRKTLSDIALGLGFWDYVRADADTLGKLRKETLEDVYEAFIGALVKVVDKNVKRGLGYYYAYNFVESSLDDIPIEITAEALDDPITRLNELYKASEMVGNKRPLKWGDAVYYNVKMYLPRVQTLPPIETAKDGDLVFSLADKTAFVATPKGWLHVSKLPLIELHTPENLDEEESQLMWYSAVYGFMDPNNEVTVNSQNQQLILNNPEKYGASVIGHGLHFKLKDAKKLAANQALRYLQKLGYVKDYTKKSSKPMDQV